MKRTVCFSVLGLALGVVGFLIFTDDGLATGYNFLQSMRVWLGL